MTVERYHRVQLCAEADPTHGHLCHKEAGHDGQHFAYAADGREIVWLSITVPPKED